MISVDFAPNESWDDAFLSLKLLFQPWRWQYGKEIELIKPKICQLLNVSCSMFHVSLFLTGRSALFSVLEALNLSKNSQVIVQAFTCEAVILPILANNLKPIYVDIEDKTFSIDPVDFEKKITGKTKAVVLQHTFGLTPINRGKIISIVRKNNLLLIEDIAHGFVKKKNQRLKIKDQKYIYLMSFGRSKALSSVFGGAIVTNNKIIIKNLNNSKARLPMPSLFFILRLLFYKPISLLIKSTYDIFLGKILHKILNLLPVFVPEITKKEKGGKFDPILNKAYPNALAVLLLHQLDKYEQVQKNRSQVSAMYSKRLGNIPPAPLLRFPLLIDKRDEIIKKGQKKNIFLGKWYDQVVAPKSLNLNKAGYQKGSCSKAETICKMIINLPTNISQNQADKIIKMLYEYR